MIDWGKSEGYEEVMQVDESVEWDLAIKDEIDSLLSNETWQLTELPKSKKALNNKYIY